jgi:hypothetical protein
VRRRLDAADDEISAAGGRLAEASNRYADALAIARDDVRGIWPELNSAYAPLAVALASERAEEFIARVSALDSYRELREATAARQQANDAQLNLERTEAKVQRLLRTCEDIVLAANLPKVATPEIAARYEQLVKLECGTLAESR